MDLLKGITRGLRGSDESANRETGSRTTGNRRTDGGTPADGGDVGSDPTDAATGGEDAGAAEPGRDDQHVCPFCTTEFDASRGRCPSCDAEIVLRGDR